MRKAIIKALEARGERRLRTTITGHAVYTRTYHAQKRGDALVAVVDFSHAPAPLPVWYVGPRSLRYGRTLITSRPCPEGGTITLVHEAANTA